jgi:hypothetical protein
VRPRQGAQRHSEAVGSRGQASHRRREDPSPARGENGCSSEGIGGPEWSEEELRERLGGDVERLERELIQGIR